MNIYFGNGRPSYFIDPIEIEKNIRFNSHSKRFEGKYGQALYGVLKCTLIVPRHVQEKLFSLPILNFRVGSNHESFYAFCKECCLVKNTKKDW